MQKPFSPSSVIVDADPWLRQSRLPYWGLAQIRQLRVGEGIDLVHFKAPLLGELDGNASVSIERVRGHYRLSVVWLATLEKNRAKPRGHIWWELNFKLLSGRKLELLPDHHVQDPEKLLEGLRISTLVMRRASMLAAWAKRDGDSLAAMALRPRCYRGAPNRSADAVGWLVKTFGTRSTSSAQMHV